MHIVICDLCQKRVDNDKWFTPPVPIAENTHFCSADCYWGYVVGELLKYKYGYIPMRTKESTWALIKDQLYETLRQEQRAIGTSDLVAKETDFYFMTIIHPNGSQLCLFHKHLFADTERETLELEAVNSICAFFNDISVQYEGIKRLMAHYHIEWLTDQ